MDVQVVESGSCRRTLTIRIPSSKVREHLDAMFQSAAGQVNLKGFRNGRVPRKVLEKKFGDEIRTDAKKRIVSQSLNDAVREREYQVVGTPRVEGIDGSPIDDSQDFEFTVQVDVRPDIAIGDLSGIEVAAQSSEVSDEDVQKALEQLADQKKTLDTVEEPVAEGDFLVATVAWLDEAGNEVLTKEDMKLNTGIPLAGADPEVFKASLLEKSTGDSVEIELTFPDGFEVEDQRGKPGKARVTLNEVQRVTPAPIDDELAKGFEFDTLEAMSEELRKRIAFEKERGEKARQEQSILDQLAAKFDFDLPESMVEDQERHNLKGFAERLAKNGLDEESIKAKLEEARPEARKAAEQTIRMFFLMDTVAREHEVRLEQSDIEQQMAEIAEANGVEMGVVQEYYSDRERMSDLQTAVMERKVRDLLREKASISDSGTAASGTAAAADE